MNKLNGMILGAFALALMSLNPSSANAAAIISSGNVALGINDHGELNTRNTGPVFAANSSRTGLAFFHTSGPDSGTWQDATSPGCFCEGWGAAATAGATPHTSSANVSSGGITNLTLDSFVSTATTATSSVHLTSLPGFKVVQEYFPAPGAPTALFQNRVTLTNDTGGTLTDVRYTRAMDWDIPPTEFREYVTIGGLPAAAVLHTNTNGFDSSSPYRAYSDYVGCGSGGAGINTTNVNIEDCGSRDHGAVFDFGFGTLEDGESHTFSIYYGAAPTEAAAFDALGEVGAEVYSLGQNSAAGGHTTGSPATYIFAFGGVGGVALPDPTPDPTPGTEVPEPSTLFMLAAGAGFAFLRRKKK